MRQRFSLQSTADMQFIGEHLCLPSADVECGHLGEKENMKFAPYCQSPNFICHKKKREKKVTRAISGV